MKWFSLLLVSLFLFSCGKSEEQKVKELVLQYYKDSKTGNYASMEKYVVGDDFLFEIVKTGKEKDMKILKAIQEKAAEYEESIKKVEFSEDGSKAKVCVLLKNKDGVHQPEQTLDLRKTDGSWKIYLGIPGR